MVRAEFLIELRGTGAAGHTSRHKDIIKIGMNITFHMVLRVASCSQFLAGLMAKLSIVPPSNTVLFTMSLFMIYLIPLEEQKFLILWSTYSRVQLRLKEKIAHSTKGEVLNTDQP